VEWFNTMTTANASLTRPDPLAEFNAPAAPPVDLRGAGRAIGAFALLAAGLVATGWLLYLVHSALFHPDKLGFLARLVPPDAAERILTLPAGKVELSAAGMSALGYVLLIVVIGIASRVAVALVKEGAWLLRQEVPNVPAPAPSDRAPASPKPPVAR
jgi:hypothetical protein